MSDERCEVCGFLYMPAGSGRCGCAVYDQITQPEHYLKDRTIEPLDVINDWKLSFMEGAVLKYLSRAGRKPGSSRLEDLNKARFYIERLIEREKDV